MRTIQWIDDRLRILDQTRLPREEVYLELQDHQGVAQAIREMRLRGAPAIGVAAAYGIALGAQQIEAQEREAFLEELRGICDTLRSTRPTAVNLFWAIDKLQRVARESGTIAEIKAALLAEARRIEAEDEEANRCIGAYGAELIGEGFAILTHCNAGALATAGYGTALGVIRAAHEQGKQIRVYVDETRPLLQGSRLTAWELMREGIPFTLIADTMAGHFLGRAEIDCVIVGADRIAANGDVANKIGTYQLAVLAKENGVPFYVAAPTSTIDLALASGLEIPIEERSPQEVTHIQGVPIAPEGVRVANPAFDVTPHRYVSAIITEKGVVREPYEEGLRMAVRG